MTLAEVHVKWSVILRWLTARTVIMMLFQKTSTKTFLFKEHFDLSYVRNIAMRILIFTFTFNLNFKIRIFNMFFHIFVLLLM